MKILLVRFSSIGDIVLTSPVIRCLKAQLNEVELHFLTKDKFQSILDTNPNLSKIYTIQKSYKEILPELKTENYDVIIDLHHNIRTLGLKLKLGVRNYSFPKMNVKKWVLVNFKINRMPKLHIVERYFLAVKHLGVKNDKLPCDFFLNPEDQVDIKALFGFQDYIAFAIGAQFATKRMNLKKIIELIDTIDKPVILLGDQNDVTIANKICAHFPTKQLEQACGKFSIRQSASILKQAKVILTHDTGLMHIASAFQKPIVSIWGNTVPSLGMYPYFPQQKDQFSIHEVENLSCRPCSKIGFKTCPKKHFKCMEEQNVSLISEDLKKRLEACD